MDCHKTQLELTGGSVLIPEAQKHLEGCAECERFADDLRALRVLTETPLTAPAGLRERTLKRCQSMLAEKETARGRTFWQRFRHQLDSPQFVASTAIFGLIILGALATLQINDLRDENADLFMQISIVQILIQNFVAALFLPALLILKNKIAERPPYTMELGE